jgi:hypothetical protein
MARRFSTGRAERDPSPYAREVLFSSRPNMCSLDRGASSEPSHCTLASILDVRLGRRARWRPDASLGFSGRCAVKRPLEVTRRVPARRIAQDVEVLVAGGRGSRLAPRLTRCAINSSWDSGGRAVSQLGGPVAPGPQGAMSSTSWGPPERPTRMLSQSTLNVSSPSATTTSLPSPHVTVSGPSGPSEAGRFWSVASIESSPPPPSRTSAPPDPVSALARASPMMTSGFGAADHAARADVIAFTCHAAFAVRSSVTRTPARSWSP